MLLPTVFRSVEEDYHHLKNAVQVWDVACERQVEITGPDAKKLIEMLTPRDLRKLTIDKCLYAPLTNLSGGIINDPLILKFNDQKFWISIADTDVLLWCKGVALSKNFKVEVSEPEACPLSLQGPKAKDLMQKITNNNEAVMSLKYYEFIETKLFDLDLEIQSCNSLISFLIILYDSHYMLCLLKI